MVNEKIALLMTKLLEHLFLTGASVLVAIVISIPLGILFSRKSLYVNPLLAFSSLFQTLPSLAIMGILLPFLGIGLKTTLVTLVLYAIFPILSNTVMAFKTLPLDALEAADSLGFTPWQKLKEIEIPLALPLMMNGIRIATAMSVGVATLAAFIGAGGLGDFIYEGLSLNDPSLILWGAIPALFLALILDLGIGKMIHHLSVAPKSRIQLKKILFVSFFLVGLMTFFSLRYVSNDESHTVKIGTKNFTEQFILGELLAQLLEKHTSLHVIRKFNLGGTFVCHQALIRGDIDLYPEYTGTGYSVILKKTDRKNPAEILSDLRTDYRKKFNVAWLEPFGFNNTNALAVLREFATAHSLKTISQLYPLAAHLQIGVPADFMERPDGFLGLKKQYHLNFKQVKLMDPGLMYRAIASKELEIIMASSTDARIEAYHLVLLEDDQQLYPNYFAAPIVRNEWLRQHAEVIPVLKKLANKINNETIQSLNYQVDVLKRSPEAVVREFLLSAGISSGTGAA